MKCLKIIVLGLILVSFSIIQLPAQSRWEFLGPDSMPVGPEKGRDPNGMGLVSALHVDPRDNNTMFVGSNTGGLFKTTDGGNHWKCISDKDFPDKPLWNRILILQLACLIRFKYYVAWTLG